MRVASSTTITIVLLLLVPFGIVVADDRIDITDTIHNPERIWDGVQIQDVSTAIQLDGVENVRISNCMLSQTENAAIVIRRSSNVTIEDCGIRHTHSSGGGLIGAIHIEGSTGIMIRNVSIERNRSDAVLIVRDSQDVTIEQLSASRNIGSGILIENSTNVRIQGAAIEGNWGHGMIITGNETTVDIVDSTIERNSKDGLWLSDVDGGVIILDSTITQNGLYGIHLAWGVKDASIKGNTISENGSGGVRIAGSCSNTFTENTLVSPGVSGWIIDGERDPSETLVESYRGPGCQIAGNTFRENTIRAGEEYLFMNTPDSAEIFSTDNLIAANNFEQLLRPKTTRHGIVLGVSQSVKDGRSQGIAIALATLGALVVLALVVLLQRAMGVLKRSRTSASILYHHNTRQWRSTRIKNRNPRHI